MNDIDPHRPMEEDPHGLIRAVLYIGIGWVVLFGVMFLLTIFARWL